LSTLLPIENENSSFLFLESNNNLSESLKNIFFVEFDLTSNTTVKETQTNTEKRSVFTKINGSFSDSEFSFSLNVFYQIKINILILII